MDWMHEFHKKKMERGLTLEVSLFLKKVDAFYYQDVWLFVCTVCTYVMWLIELSV